MHLTQAECVQSPVQPCYGLKGDFEPIWMTMNRSAGYTLLEVLIMLAVTAILAATVLETVRASASNGLRIEQAARNASQDYITLAGVRRAVENTRAEYTNEPGVFVGDDTQFSALTSQALMTDRPYAQRYTLRLINEPDGVALLYEDQSGDFRVSYWPGSQGRFFYYGPELEPQSGFVARPGEPTDRVWRSEWPFQTGLRSQTDQSYFRALPLAIRAEIEFPTGEVRTIVFQLQATAPPTPRIEDVLGTLGP
jgi:type II secretory pathway pseudopilin PulG